MKHLLFDLSCLQLGPKVGGAAAYAKRVLEELVQYPVTLYAVFAVKSFAFGILTSENREQYNL